jgi:hypothetical protein
MILKGGAGSGDEALIEFSDALDAWPCREIYTSGIYTRFHIDLAKSWMVW